MVKIGRKYALLMGFVALVPREAAAQAPPDDDGVSLTVSTEIKANLRWSEDDRFPIPREFPPDFVPLREPNVALQTVDPGTSLEIDKATIFLDVELPRQIAARVKVDFVDLHDRNPTSTDKYVDLDEAWVSFGRRQLSLRPIEGASLYGLVGKAPKFERQLDRHLESYGLVSTAFNRFNDIQLQAGGSLGTFVYFFGQVSSGNPMFFRDPNALAGDNGTGTPPPPRPDPALHSGFPVFYHAEVEDLQLDEHLEYGGGLGLRVLSFDERRGVDVLGFYYETRLSEAAKLNGTYYEGDLEILEGAGTPPDQLEGDRRTEWGGNLDVRLGGFSLFGQLVEEEAAGLPRTGVEVEVAYRLVLGDPADPSSLLTWVQPAVRYSRLDNDFTAPASFITKSALWDWQKWDFGLRVGIIQRLDLTLEYAHNEIAASRPIQHDEFLATLRLRY